MMPPDGEELGTAAYPGVQHHETSHESAGEKDTFSFFIDDSNILGTGPTWVTLDVPRATSGTELIPASVSFTTKYSSPSGTQPITCLQFSHTRNHLPRPFRLKYSIHTLKLH